MNDRLSVCIAETWFGESHETLFSGIVANSSHECRLVTLPARKWRWRMRFGAAHLAEQLDSLDPWPDALLVSDYVNLPVLRGLCQRASTLPTAIYFLENQLTYPARKGSRGDFEFMAVNVLSCLAADRCVFCSKNQLEAMLAAIPGFLRHDPDADPEAIVSRIAVKSEVIPIGVDLEPFDQSRSQRSNRVGQPLHIVWPHRFEHDKNPDDFFDVLLDLEAEGLPFMVSVLGRSYRDLPDSISVAKERLEGRIVRWGFLEGSEYADALATADVVVSTAWQETQGIAVIEAIRAGCDPLLPDRLSYPELLGPLLCDKHLYSSKGDLRRRLRWMMRHPDRVRTASNHWREMDRFGWPAVGPQFDELVRQLSSTT